MKRPTLEQIETLKQMKTEEELVVFAKENGINLYSTDIPISEAVPYRRHKFCCLMFVWQSNG